MDGADLSEDGTCKRQEGLPSGGRSPQTTLCGDHRPSSENHILGVSGQVSAAAGDAQEGATCQETCGNADTALTTDKMNENAVEKKYDEEQRCTTHPPGPARGDLPQSNISDILQQHLSKEEFLKGEGIDCETLPEIPHADSSDEAVVKSGILCHIEGSWPEEQAPELAGQLAPDRGDGSGSAEPGRSPSPAGECTSEPEQPAAAGDGRHPEGSSSLTEARSPSHKHTGHPGQTPQRQQTEKTGSGLGFQDDQAHHQFSDVSNVAPTGKTPENNGTDKPLPTDKQDHFSHELRDRLALVQDILESLSRSNGAEKGEQERKTPDPPRETELSALRGSLNRPPTCTPHPLELAAHPSHGEVSLHPHDPGKPQGSSSCLQESPRVPNSQRPASAGAGRPSGSSPAGTGCLKSGVRCSSSPPSSGGRPGLRRFHSIVMETKPTRHSYPEHLAGTEPETSLFKSTSASRKNPPASSSYIFQKLSHGKRMCQKLREQTDRLRSKVQEFSRSIAQDSPRHVRDKRLALEKLQGHLALLKQECVANKEEHLTWKQQVCTHEPPAVSDFDPERKAEGEMFRLGTLLEGVKEKIHGGKHTSGRSPPTPADLPPVLPPSHERDPHSPSGRQKCAGRAETTGRSCVFCHRVLEWKQNMERKGHRRISGGRLPTALQEQALHSDSSRSPDPELSGYSASGPGPRSDKCETCGTEIANSPRGCRRGALREFHYRYNRLGQHYSNHEGGSAFVQLCFLNENKNSSPSCSKPNWIYSESTDSKLSQDEHEPIPGKNHLTAFMAYSADLASSSPHCHSRRVSGSNSSGNLSSVEETKSEGLTSSLDNALRTAIVLKETTDRMVRTIAEDLAKVQRWRNRLKY